MGIYRLAENLKTLAINIKMVQMASFGDLMLFDDKPVIKYPYVNIDIIGADVTNFVQTYKLRVYVCDRNKPHIAYNKTETILNQFLKNNDLDITNYTINYFSVDFKDQVNGVYADIIFTVPLVTECETYTDLGEGYMVAEMGRFFMLSEEGELNRTELGSVVFVRTEDGDFLVTEKGKNIINE